MSSLSVIQFNYKQALAQADKLEGIASDMSRVAKTDMENSMRTLSNGWKGSNANAFIAKETRVQGNVNELAKTIRNIAADIRRVAWTIYQAEMEALRIAQERKS